MQLIQKYEIHSSLAQCVYTLCWGSALYRYYIEGGISKGLHTIELLVYSSHLGRFACSCFFLKPRLWRFCLNCALCNCVYSRTYVRTYVYFTLRMRQLVLQLPNSKSCVQGRYSDADTIISGEIKVHRIRITVALYALFYNIDALWYMVYSMLWN